MKLERINENKIKCILSRTELADMHINLTELAYGTEKAKELFKDLMYKAKEELGFEADETPLMIEAIPVKPDSLMLIITKVENPEEMNSRFSKFAGDDISMRDPFSDQSDEKGTDRDSFENIDDLDDLGDLEDVTAGKSDDKFSHEMTQNEMMDEDSEKDPYSNPIYLAFAFDKLGDLIEVAHIVSGFYKSSNSLYLSPRDNRYYLVMYRNKNTYEEFKRAGLKAGEYGRAIGTVYTSIDYFDEHFRMIVKDEALQRLADMK